MKADTRRVSDYEVGGVIGHGLIGVLREGRFLPSDKPVVLEEIPTDLFADGAFMKRLAKAGKTLSQHTSPHLVSVYNIVDTSELTAIVSEPSGGPSVAALTAQRPLSGPGAVAVARDVLDGLATLHRAGLHHGDINSATVAVTSAGEARITEAVVAAARSSASASTDLEAVTTLLLALMGDSPIPLQLASALSRAPGRGTSNSFTSADEYRDALDDAAKSTFGKNWRDTTNLGERASGTPQAAVATDIAAVSASTAPTPQATDAATVAATASAPAVAASAPRRHKRWPWVLVIVVLILAAAGGGVAYFLTANQRNSVAPIPAGATVGIGNDLALVVATKPGATGSCDTTFGFTATATVNGTGDITYQWERSTGGVATPQTLHVDSSDGSFRLTTAWRLTGSNTVNGTMTFHITKPVDRKISQPVKYSCP